MDAGVQPNKVQSSNHISNIIIIKFLSFDLSALMLLSYNDVFSDTIAVKGVKILYEPLQNGELN